MLVRRTEPLAIECVAQRLPVRLGMEGLSCDRARLRHRAAGGPARDRPAAAPHLHAGDQGGERTRREHHRTQAASIVGDALLDRLEALTLALYARGTAHAASRGIILADTKFEFGLLPGASAAAVPPEPILIDEVMTPDSSRFWPADQYAPGGPQPSFDKQFVRDYLESIRWNKQPPVPSLPDEVVARTRDKYLDAHRRLTGREIA